MAGQAGPNGEDALLFGYTKGAGIGTGAGRPVVRLEERYPGILWEAVIFGRGIFWPEGPFPLVFLNSVNQFSSSKPQSERIVMAGAAVAAVGGGGVGCCRRKKAVKDELILCRDLFEGCFNNG